MTLTIDTDRASNTATVETLTADERGEHREQRENFALWRSLPLIVLAGLR